MLEQTSSSFDLPFEGHLRGGSARQITIESLQPRIEASVVRTERVLAGIVARSRPVPLREFDQIPMRTEDLARQANRVAPLLADQRVAFVGDMDGTASLLGLIAAAGGPAPAHLLILDFDARVLKAAETLAERYGFADRLTTRLYNCFAPLPPQLLGQWDWFYTNPPYGSRNNGASGCLFITRGCELVRPEGSGCLILPDDPSRPWTRQAMQATQQFLLTHGWMIRSKADNLHQYDLDDDPELSSSLIVVDSVVQGDYPAMPFAGRRVDMGEIPSFYGRSIRPPYPAMIGQDGAFISASDAA